MSTTLKTGLWILVIIFILGGFWSFMSSKKGSISYKKDINMEQKIPSEILTPSNSNNDLAKDVATIDTKLKSIDSDSHSMEQIFNDRPVTQ